MNSNFLTTAVAALVLLAMAVTQCDAQLRQVGNQDSVKQYKRQLEEEVKAQKRAAERKIAIHIDDIHRVCELSESQLKKIRIAAKGAVAKVEGKAREQMEASLKQVQRRQRLLGQAVEVQNDEENAGDEDAEGDDEATDKDEKVDVQVVQEFAQVQVAPNNFVVVGQAFGGRIGGRPNGVSVENQKIWVNSLDKILTAEQIKRYDAETETRENFQRAAAVDRFVATIDRSLLLSADQRKELRILIDLEFGDQLMAQEKQAANLAWFDAGVANSNSKVAKNKLDFLTENQRKEWMVSINPLLMRLAPRNGIPLLNNRR